MPKLTPNLPPPMVPWTKVPNLVLDKLLPELRDTELRVLLVLLRNTYGWNQERRPVILSYRSLMKRTGRGSEAIGKAIKSLREKQLIHTSRVKAPKRFRFPTTTTSKSE